MELSEVVNPHFAFPVVGVVICAVLVFAFGFKSPVQPPSFDFIPEERRARKIKQKKKAQSNGHVVTLENLSPSARQQAAKAPPQTPKAEKGEQPKAKAKKHSRTQKQLPQADVVNETPKEVADDGEWTTAISKKVKKMRSKHTDEPKAKEDSVKEVAASLSTEAESPQDQRPKKASPRVKKDPSKGIKKDSPVAQVEKEPSPVKESPAAVKEATTTLQATPTSSPELPKEELPKEELPKEEPPKEEAKVSKDTTEEKKKTPEGPKKATEAPKKSPKKAKKKAKSPEVPPQEEVEEVGATVDTPNSVTAAAESSEVSGPESAAPVTVSGGFTEVKSPKTKKKKSRESREKFPEPSPVASQDASQEDASSKNTLITKLDGASADSQSQRQPVSKGAATEPVSDKSTPASASKPAASEEASGTTNLVFDDMGVWEDAKPVKRKKKARREN